ncbi:MAG: hypothetical protein IKJ72_00605 [Mycoplasmataceae bacterium]|nr:hypothetical protein [Mycoplasmataceae bacterium]
MIKTLQHLKNGIIDNGCYTSDDFKKFVRTFRSEFKKEVAKIGGENVEIKGGHYYLYGFFTLNNQAYYISISDVRYFKVEDILIRTAKSYKDFTGGINNFIKIKPNLFENVNLKFI